MKFSRKFYRAAAVCSFISAASTLLLIFLPKFYGPLTSLQERVDVVQHPLYQVRAWAYLLHPFMVMTAALAVAAALRRTAASLVIPGLLGFLLWGFTEAGQQTLTFALFRRWAVEYQTADDVMRETLRAQIGIYDALWDAMFLLLLLGFFAGNVLYGIATVRRRGLTRVLGVFYFGAAFLTLAGISGELHGPVLPPFLNTWLYPLLQPAARFLIGIWLWKSVESDKYEVLET